MAGLHLRFESTPDQFLDKLTEHAYRVLRRGGARRSPELLKAALRKTLKRVIRQEMQESARCGSHIIGICAHAERREPWSQKPEKISNKESL